MKKIINKLKYFTFDAIAFMFYAILVWVIISTVEVSFFNNQNVKQNKFNLFIFSQNHKLNNDIEIITEDDAEDDEEENEIINC